MSSFTRRSFLSGAALAFLGSACTGKRGSKLPSGGKRPGGGVVPGGGGALGPSTGDVFGYQRAFERELARIGQIAPAELGALPGYLGKLSFDPTKAKFFADFGKAGLGLDAAETLLYRKNGFVVSSRLRADSYAEQYYRIFTSDLPVFISADSVLHAWHRSYDAVLEQLEDSYLFATVDDILTGMADGLPAARKDYGDGALAASLGDADYFLAVARSLLAGGTVAAKLGAAADRRADATLSKVKQLALEEFALFGIPRVVDFSQFKVRGHYENSKRLSQYFQAMMWLGRIDLRIAGDPGDPDGHQLASAVVLHDLLRRSGREPKWAQLDRLLQTFVGRTDSMTFAQLGTVLAAGGIQSPAALADSSVRRRLLEDIDKKQLGLQQIRSDYFESSPLGPDKVELPRSFTVMGQKFVVDSWATAKIVADDITWDGIKVQRRVPSALDVAYSVLGNDAAIPTLVKRIHDKGGVKFRDGLPVQHNLAAVRAVIDGHPAQAWQDNLYMGWLGTLRALSEPTTDAKYPEVMRMQAWGQRTMNTQLASWAELRHDTILYVKQSYTAGVSCFHPAGFVDARPEFWTAFVAMARRAGKLLRATPVPGAASAAGGLEQQAAFFERFADTIAQLESIASKQLARADLSEAEARMLKDVVQISYGSGFTRYNGWYPTLFYKGEEDSGKADEIVADVHTDVPAPMLGDPGGVLHQAIGHVDLLMLAVDCDGEAITYAGPTASHYEIATEGMVRLSDSEWAKTVQDGKAPARPEWTASYLR